MVYKCCVTNCRGNYDKDVKVTMFRFPKNKEKLKEWLAAIPRENFTPSKHSRVCQQHFTEGDVQQHAEAFDEGGKKLSVNLQQLRLTKEAVPSIFPGCPKYLSKEVLHRPCPDLKKEAMENNQLSLAIQESIKSADTYYKKNTFINWKELNECMDNFSVPNYWNAIKTEDDIIFFHLKMIPCPQMEKSVVIDKKCNIKACIDQLPLTKVGKFSLPFQCTNLFDLENILNMLENVYSSQSSNDLISSVYNCLSSYLEASSNETNKNVLVFILEQLKLLQQKKQSFRYSSDFLILCTLMFSISPHNYRFLRNSGYLILPHPNTLKLLCTKFNVNPQDDYNLNYISSKFVHLNEKDKKVILMLDEIHLKPFLDYKGGDILGISCNTEKAATTAYVFMIQSLTSSYKDVIYIMPIRKITADFLYSVISKLVVDLENLGFCLFCVSSDNNAINKRAMSYFANPPTQTFVYKHPLDDNRPLFYVRDPVHLLKCIRNNWLNQKNSDQSLYFPNFGFNETSDIVSMKTAPFKTVKTIFEIERNQLVKHCHTLTQKSISPSNLDRQNVKFVVQIFNSHLVEGLLQAGPKYDLQHHQDTADFVKIILTWWEIMNVKTVFKGKHKRNVFEKPLPYLKTDVKIMFLYTFLNWLDKWKESNLDSGMLSEETHTALWQTTYAIIEIARYCTENFNVQYILTAKFQTDSLENRFGQYRQLAGAQYHITLTQLLEVEKKLRIQTILPLNLVSNTLGSISVESNLDYDAEDHPLDLSLPKNHVVFLLKKFDITFDDNDYAKIMSIEEILVYIAGYCIHSCIKRIKCDPCLNKLTATKDITSSSLIEELNRGGLKFPNESVVDIISTCYIIVSKLISEKFEGEFLKIDKKRITVYTLTEHFLNVDEKSFDFEVCVNGHSGALLQKYIINSCINTLLKNYCKNSNNELNKSKSKKRKLKTLTLSKVPMNTVDATASSKSVEKCKIQKPIKKCKVQKRVKKFKVKAACNKKYVKSKPASVKKALNLCLKKKKTI